MKPEDAEEYTQALGQVVSGSYRQIVLAKNLGVPEALGLSLEQWVTTRIGGYVRLSIDERREAVKELTEEGMSQREVGEVLGVSQMQVSRDLNPETNVSGNDDSEHKPETNVSEPEPPKPEHDLAKELEQAARQDRQVRARHLFIILGALGLGKETPAQKASELLDYDQRSFATMQMKITSELLHEAAKTFNELIKQWEAQNSKAQKTCQRPTK